MSLSDLKEADYVTYNLTNKIMESKSSSELESVLQSLGHIAESGAEEGEFPLPTSSQKKFNFVYTSLNGMEKELVPGGRERVIR